MSTITIETPKTPTLTVAPVSRPKAKPLVRALQLSEYKPAARVLAEAFFDDDVGRYFLDTPAREHWSEAQKWALHLSIFEYLTYAHILAGLGTTAGDDYGCVALWLVSKFHTQSSLAPQDAAKHLRPNRHPVHDSALGSLAPALPALRRSSLPLLRRVLSPPAPH